MISEESQTNKATAISSNSGVKLLQNFGNPTIIEQKNEKKIKEHRLVGILLQFLF